MFRIGTSLILFLILWDSLAGQAILQINDFKAFESDMQLVADATFEEDFLRLTPSEMFKRGACWYSGERVDLVQGFQIEFEFQISGKDDKYNGGDGFAFVLQDIGPDAIGGAGEDIGYQGIKNGIAFEFDTYDNQEGSRDHVNLSFYDPAKSRFVRNSTVHEVHEISDGDVHWARIEYKDGFLAYYLDDPRFPVLSSRLDLNEIIGSDDGKAWMGFTSGTSFAFANHDILKWSYFKILPPPDIEEEEVVVDVAHELEVTARRLRIRVWDHNKIDGDIISLKAGDTWILTEQELVAEPFEIEVTVTGFSTILTLFANNIGKNPPNTASISIDDGNEVYTYELEADLKKSEAVQIRYAGPME